jgi:hypothetical protein
VLWQNFRTSLPSLRKHGIGAWPEFHKQRQFVATATLLDRLALQVVNVDGRYALGSGNMSVGLAKKLPSFRVQLTFKVIQVRLLSFQTELDRCTRYLQVSSTSRFKTELFWSDEESENVYMQVVEV